MPLFTSAGTWGGYIAPREKKGIFRILFKGVWIPGRIVTCRNLPPPEMRYLHRLPELLRVSSATTDLLRYHLLDSLRIPVADVFLTLSILAVKIAAWRQFLTPPRYPVIHDTGGMPGPAPVPRVPGPDGPAGCRTAVL